MLWYEAYLFLSSYWHLCCRLPAHDQDSNQSMSKLNISMKQSSFNRTICNAAFGPLSQPIIQKSEQLTSFWQRNWLAPLVIAYITTRCLQIGRQFPSKPVPHKYMIFECVFVPISKPCYFSKSRPSQMDIIQHSYLSHISPNIFKPPLNRARLPFSVCNMQPQICRNLYKPMLIFIHRHHPPTLSIVSVIVDI